jgi:glycosyltransferase involved in cell wall biosynthesis
MPHPSAIAAIAPPAPPTGDEPRRSAPIAIFITTKNEEVNLPHALASVSGWAREVFVLDSGSTDRTREIAEAFGARFYHHDWLGYAGQKNWGLDHLPMTAPWVFILDADEAITPALRDELVRIATEDRCHENGFFVNRFFVFLNKRIRHCGYYPSWNVRFFRRGRARYEARDVHEHMVVDGVVGYLPQQAAMAHNDRRGLEDYIAKHNRYSTLEAREMFKLLNGRSTESPESFWSGPQARRRWVKRVVWPRLPARWFFRWVYQYVLRLGFLDGRIGWHFCLFLAAYEHQISLKLRELIQQSRSTPAPTPAPDRQPASDESAPANAGGR